MVFNLLTATNRVIIGSMEHLIPVVLSIIFGILLINYAQSAPKVIQIKIFKVLGWFVSLTVIIFHLYFIFFEDYNIKTDLPLYLCSFIAVLIPVFTQLRHYWLYEILVFWTIAGTLQGVITPDIATGFPTFDYLRYWVVHSGLLTIIFYATFVFGMRPTFKSVFKSFFALQIYVLMMVLINSLLDANYFYLNQKPKSASILDYFGEWPLYIMVVQILVIPYFLVIYLPFYLKRRNVKTTSQTVD